MEKIHYEQLIIALKLHFWLRKSWTPANFCQGNAPGISAEFYPPQKLCIWPLLPTDKGTDTFFVPFTMPSVYILQFQPPWLQLHPKEQTQAWGSCSLSTFHSKQAQKDPEFCILWLNTFIPCLLWNCIYCTQIFSSMPFISSIVCPSLLLISSTLRLCTCTLESTCKQNLN